MRGWALAVLGVVAVGGSACGSGDSPAGPGDGSREVTVLATPEWERASSAAGDGTGFLLGVWRGGQDVTSTYPTAQAGTASVVLVTSGVTGTSLRAGAPLDLGHTQGDAPIVAWDGSNYVVLYSDGAAGSARTYAQFLDRSGARVGSAYPLGQGDVTWSIAYGGGSYLFAYDRAGGSGRVRTLSATGALGPEITVVDPGTARQVAFDGTNFDVLYEKAVSTGRQVRLALVNPGGQLLRDVLVGTAPAYSAGAVLAVNGNRMLVAWDEGSTGSRATVQAVSTAGDLVDNPSPLLSTSRMIVRKVVPNGLDFVLHYSDGSQEMLRSFNNSGVPLSSAVPAFPPGAVSSLVMTPANTGQLFIAYSRAGTGGTWDVFGRITPTP